MVSESDTDQCDSEDVGLQGEWIMRSHIGWRGERNILYEGVETSLQQTRFKIVRLTAIRNGPKWTIFISGWFELLQMVLESDTGRCTSEDAGLPKGWIVRSHVGWKEERNIPYKGVETFS